MAAANKQIVLLLWASSRRCVYRAKVFEKRKSAWNYLTTASMELPHRSSRCWFLATVLQILRTLHRLPNGRTYSQAGCKRVPRKCLLTLSELLTRSSRSKSGASQNVFARKSPCFHTWLPPSHKAGTMKREDFQECTQRHLALTLASTQTRHIVSLDQDGLPFLYSHRHSLC